MMWLLQLSVWPPSVRLYFTEWQNLLDECSWKVCTSLIEYIFQWMQLVLRPGKNIMPSSLWLFAIVFSDSKDVIFFLLLALRLAGLCWCLRQFTRGVCCCLFVCLFLLSGAAWYIGTAHYNSVINGRARFPVCGRLHVSHRDGPQLWCGEESHAVQTSAHRHSRFCYGRYDVYVLKTNWLE